MSKMVKAVGALVVVGMLVMASGCAKGSDSKTKQTDAPQPTAPAK